MIIQGIVRLPYSDLSGVYQRISTKFAVFLVNEHAADAKIKTTHCHFLIDLSGSFANLDSARKWLKSLSPLMRKPHYELHTETQELPHRPYDKDLLARYILKGDQPILSKGFTEACLIKTIGSWQLEQVPEAQPSSDPVAAKARGPTQYQMLLEMLDEPSAAFGLAGDGGYNSYNLKPKDKVVSPRDLMSIVIKVLKRHTVCPHPKTINNMIGSMFNMVEDDINYNGYEEVSLRGYTYKFSQS